MKRCSAFGFSILMVFSSSTFSYDGCRSPVDADLSPCLSLTNRALKDVYDELMNVIQTPLLDEHEKTELRRDELQWLKLRDQQCEVKSNTKFHSIREWLHSIEVDKTKSRCVVEMTNKRIDELELVKKKKDDAIKSMGNVSVSSVAPKISNIGQDVFAFIPRGYAIFEKVEKDLNGDGLKDVAMILRPTMPNDLNPRPFLILFSQSGGGYVLSARNDNVAPNGEAGGISNPNGADSLIIQGKSVVIVETGGSAAGSYGGALEFSLIKNTWYLVSRSEWYTSTDAGICENAEAPKLSMPWHCWKHEVHTNLINGQVTESWFAHNDDNNRDRTKTIHRHVKANKLILLNEWQVNDQ